jgi:hypothetical protein
MTRLPFNLLRKDVKSGLAKTLGNGVLHGGGCDSSGRLVEVPLRGEDRAECGQDLRKVNGTANVAQSPGTIYPQVIRR